MDHFLGTPDQRPGTSSERKAKKQCANEFKTPLLVALDQFCMPLADAVDREVSVLSPESPVGTELWIAT